MGSVGFKEQINSIQLNKHTLCTLLAVSDFELNHYKYAFVMSIKSSVDLDQKNP